MRTNSTQNRFCEAIGKTNHSRCRLRSTADLDGKKYCTKHAAEYRKTVQLTLSLTLPVTSAPCTRGFMAYVASDSYEPSVGSYRIDFILEHPLGRFPSGPWPPQGSRCAWFWGPDLETARRLVKRFNTERIPEAERQRLLKVAGLEE